MSTPPRSPTARQRREMQTRLALAVELAKGGAIADAASAAGLTPARAAALARSRAVRVIAGAIQFEATNGTPDKITGLIGAVLRRHGIDPDEVMAAICERPGLNEIEHAPTPATSDNL